MNKPGTKLIRKFWGVDAAIRYNRTKALYRPAAKPVNRRLDK
jgi:hypothetical protein